ncbi:hypothetical protein JXA88_01665 [Candidatus Fermentibacteria bacterium]|nr:hypothetical protein [Candidatus Fermentibacteria bacterium]
MGLAVRMIRTAFAVLRSNPGAWIESVAWYCALTCAVLCGAAALDVACTASRLMEDSAGVHVFLAPDALGLAALDQAIEALPGVRDARFVVRHVSASGADSPGSVHTPGSVPRQALYVRTTSVDADSLAVLAGAIHSFPQVDEVLYSSDFLGSAAGVVASCRYVAGAAWGAVALLALVAGRWCCAGLVRLFGTQAMVASLLGGSWWAAAAPVIIAGASAGAVGSLLGWVLVGGMATTGTTLAHEALRRVGTIGPMVTGSTTGLGALGSLVGATRVISGRSLRRRHEE